MEAAKRLGACLEMSTLLQRTRVATFDANQPDVVHTKVFGSVSNSKIDAAEYCTLLDLAQTLFDRSRTKREPDEETLELIDALRTGVGALWMNLQRQLDMDIEQAHAVTGSLWRCLWVSLAGRLKPQKYRQLCGTPSHGYGGLVTMLCNMPHQDELVKRWGIDSWRVSVDAMWRTKSQLMEKEREYRDLAIAIAQIGIGVGGMVLGVIGLLIAILPLSFSYVCR